MSSQYSPSYLVLINKLYFSGIHEINVFFLNYVNKKKFGGVVIQYSNYCIDTVYLVCNQGIIDMNRNGNSANFSRMFVMAKNVKSCLPLL